MFDSLRKTFSGLSKTLAEKELKETDIDDALSDMEMSLLQSDVALEVVDDICLDLKKRLTGVSVIKKDIDAFVQGALSASVSALFEDAGSLNVLDHIKEKNSKGEPYVVVFLGINGTGKTTTLAKFAYFLKERGITVAVAAADTFRAGAIEQIREHAERLQVKLVAQNYNSDPAAVAKDAVMYAKSHRVNCVLVDTAGRIQTSVNLMQQIEKITKVVHPDLKIFVGDSLAGNDAVSQAREFHEYTQFDGSILTKSDADAKGGAALSIVKITSKPILFLGVGQEYQDLKPFHAKSFLDVLFGQRLDMDGDVSAKIRDALQDSPAVDAKGADPLHGISAQDIASYSDIYGVRPPDTDEDARRLADKIQAWIKQGRPQKEILPEPTPQPELQQELEPEPESETAKSDDPFVGISNEDIRAYSDMFDVAPPDTDEDAQRMADDIRAWIKGGRQENVVKPKSEPELPEPEPEPESKKKRGLFGRFRR